MENGNGRIGKIYPTTVREIEKFLYELPKFTSRNEHGNTRQLLHLLGDPQEKFRMIHVAGTNGKGSTCAFLESIFRCRGMKTGLFTSPHLVRCNERFRVLGKEIPDEEFINMFLRVQDAVEELIRAGGSHPTFFEYIFATGLCWFAYRQIDLLICETGMGGRLDATTSIREAEAAVITSVSLDHTEYLGDTVAKIAFEKAGIIRRGTPVIFCGKDPESAEVILKRCEEMEAPRIALLPDMIRVISRGKTGIEMELRLPEKGLRDPEKEIKIPENGLQESEEDLRDRAIRLYIPFAALYQTENAALAALCALKCGVDVRSVQKGIADTRWPGRMEELRSDVYLDGAHNIDGIRRLASEIRRIAATKKVSLLIAIVGDKAHREMVRELCAAANYEHVVTTSVGGSRAMDAKLLQKEFLQSGQKSVMAENDVKKAYRMARLQQKDSVLVCAGSLYLVGEIHALEDNQPESE